MENAAKLVLPTAAGGEQLFENEGAVAHGGLVPSQTAEVGERTEHRGCQNTARSQSRTGRNGGQKRQFDTAAESGQLVAEGGMRFG